MFLVLGVGGGSIGFIESEWLMGGFAVLFGLAMVGMVVRRLAILGPAVVLTLEGIHDKRLRVGLIRWEDIDHVWISKVGELSVLS